MFFSESFGQLAWAAESILTDSMSLMAGFYIMQSNVDKQVKYIALRLPWRIPRALSPPPRALSLLTVQLTPFSRC